MSDDERDARGTDGDDRDSADAADPLAWESLDAEVAYSCPGFDVRRERVRLPDGTETNYDYLAEPPSVVVLPFTPDGEVVVIEEWRQAVGRVNRGLPVGGTEPDDDDLSAAARRELREETGHEAEAVERLTTVEPANGVANSVLHFFVARGCTPTAQQDLDADESIRVATTTMADLREHVAADEVRDGRTTLGVLYYDAFGE
ncbi:NUDIX hydrolase [Halorussus marinus]|uniref:NUDIX hydrolase n=1 Tax=Halorussus marinus TaxID=2505976 RepID=UPI001092C11F|nr:NUDIX hydrolase [Halorussus marinus]